jgi:hypothetical protein
MSVFALEELVKNRYLKEARKATIAQGEVVINADGRIFGLVAKRTISNLS